QMPLTVLEAMAAGLPIAGVDVGDIKSMLPDESRRFIASRFDERRLTDHLTGLLSDPLLRARLRRLNRRRSSTEFSLDSMLLAYDHLFSLQHLPRHPARRL